MKKIIVLLSILMALFVSCGSGPKSASTPGGGNKSAAAPQPGQIPVEVKEMVLFADGSLDEYTTFDYDPSYENITNEARFSASDAMLEQIEFAYAEDKGYLTTKITRDVENRLKNRVVYQYNSRGQLQLEALTNKNGKAVSSYEYTYDEKGNRTSRVMNSGLNQRMAETRYTYNDRGAVVSSETRDASGAKVISSTKNTYDTDGNMIKQEVFNGAGQVTSVVDAVWQNGLELKTEQSGPDGVVQLRITNDYGPNGELTKKVIENFQGESKQITQYEYTFKPDHR
jgi:hypothetical protein